MVMTTKGIGFSALLALIGFFNTTSARAEILETVKINLDQTTAVGSYWVPAGEYRISLAQMKSNQPTLIVERIDTKASFFVPVTRVEPKLGLTSDHTGAVVRMADGHSQLVSIWIEGHTNGYELPVAANQK
jgi:hypothetical protein